MKRLKLERGKEELNSTGGNHLCGHFLRESAREHLPSNFQSRRKGAISDRDILMTMTGMLCYSRTDFTNENLYAEDTVFAHSFGIVELPSEATLRQRLDELPAQRSQSALRTLNQTLLSERSFGTVRAGHLDLVPVDIVYCAVRVIRHGRSIKLHFGKTCPWFDVIEDIARSRLRPA